MGSSIEISQKMEGNKILGQNASDMLVSSGNRVLVGLLEFIRGSGQEWSSHILLGFGPEKIRFYLGLGVRTTRCEI